MRQGQSIFREMKMSARAKLRPEDGIGAGTLQQKFSVPAPLF